MKGAREYAQLFETGQHGRLYLVSGSHTRGRTFRIYVLPAGEEAIPNGPHNPPLNKDAVEVYGIIDGQPGWTETYGWLYVGRWKDDFEIMVSNRYSEIRKREAAEAQTNADLERAKESHKIDLLSTY